MNSNHKATIDTVLGWLVVMFSYTAVDYTPDLAIVLAVLGTIFVVKGLDELDIFKIYEEDDSDD